MNAHRQLGFNQTQGAKSLEKLSSGYRINRAGDDAAGLAISEKMRGQIRGLNQATRNAQDGISMIQTAEGALNETHSILQRMRELAVQASNDTMQTEDRTAVGEELLALREEIDRVAATTQFNGKNLLNGDLATSQSGGTLTVGSYITPVDGSDLAIAAVKVDGAAAGTTYTFAATDANVTLSATVNGNTISETVAIAAMTTAGEQTVTFSTLGISFTIAGGGDADDTAAKIGVALNAKTIITAAGSTSATFAIGANAGQTMSVSFADMSASELGDGSDLATLISDNQAVSIVSLAQTLISEIDGALGDISAQRGKFGAAQNRLEHTINNLGTSAENLQAAESRIRDVDMAAEMMEFTKNNILQQAATAMLAQANMAPQSVLQLLG